MYAYFPWSAMNTEEDMEIHASYLFRTMSALFRVFFLIHFASLGCHLILDRVDDIIALAFFSFLEGFLLVETFFL